MFVMYQCIIIIIKVRFLYFAGVKHFVTVLNDAVHLHCIISRCSVASSPAEGALLLFVTFTSQF